MQNKNEDEGKKHPPNYDYTSTRRASRRRKLLDEMANNLGFKNWSNFETAVINNQITIEIKQKSLAGAVTPN